MGSCEFCGGRTTSYNVGSRLFTKCTNCRAQDETELLVRRLNFDQVKIRAIQSTINDNFERLLSATAKMDQNQSTKMAKEMIFAAYEAMAHAVKKNTNWELF